MRTAPKPSVTCPSMISTPWSFNFSGGSFFASSAGMRSGVSHDGRGGTSTVPMVRQTAMQIRLTPSISQKMPLASACRKVSRTSQRITNSAEGNVISNDQEPMADDQIHPESAACGFAFLSPGSNRKPPLNVGHRSFLGGVEFLQGLFQGSGQFGEGGCELQPAAHQHRDAVTQLLDLGQDVRDQQDRPASRLQVAHNRPQQLP